ncbi:MAG TPA: CAP domain-containing protein [Actinomycetota bacterium]
MQGKGYSRIVGSALTLVLTIALVVATVVPAGAVTRSDRRMRRATNHSRVTHDVRRVDLHAELSELARRHSAAMARRGSLFHTNDPEGYYLDGRSWRYWGENVGMTGGSVEGLQKAFMASESHRENILNRSFRNVAIGTVRRNGILWVTVFFWG